MIYLIGGAVRTGKSNLANKILASNKISVFSTDVLVGLVKDIVPFSNPDNTKRQILQKSENFYHQLKKLIDLNMEMGIEEYIYEGDIILPSIVSELSKDHLVKSAFLGFSEISVEILKKEKGNHKWVDSLSDDELEELKDKILSDSQFIKEECDKYGYQYFDLSGNYQTTHQNAYNYLIAE